MKLRGSVFSARLLVFASAWAQKLADTLRLAVVSAYKPEWRVLPDTIDEEDAFTMNGIPFTTGKLAGNDVVLYLSGVNTTMTPSSLLDHLETRSLRHHQHRL